MKALVLLGLLGHGELKYVPKWHMNPAGTEACYGFQEAKTLVLLDNQLELCSVRDVALEAAVKELQASSVQYKLALDVANKQLADDRKYEADLNAQLKKSNEEREAAGLRAQVGWMVAGGLVLVGACVGLGMWIAKR